MFSALRGRNRFILTKGARFEQEELKKGRKVRNDYSNRQRPNPNFESITRTRSSEQEGADLLQGWFGMKKEQS